MNKPLRVLITAGASGIGRGIADSFIEAGATVRVCDICQEHLDALRALQPQVGGTRLDVTDSTAIAVWIRQCAIELGGLDVLVNNAGTGGPQSVIEEFPDEEWKRTLEVNLSAAFYATKAAAAIMKPQGFGSIINISTASVRTGLPLRAAYVASKQGLMGLTLNCARELGPFGIRCNAILPGLIDNPRGRALVQRIADTKGISFAAAEASVLAYVSLRTWVDPADVGAAAVFLSSPAARRITGQFLGVCGGVEWEG